LKSISDELKAHLAGAVTTLAMCWRIRRLDGQEFLFTDHDVDLVIDDGGDWDGVYESVSGVIGTTLSYKIDLSVDNMDISGFLAAAKVSEADIAAGLFDYADVDIFLVNWTDYEADGMWPQVT
jgi:uncharacterized phage protein (TIGR02218 family)